MIQHKSVQADLLEYTCDNARAGASELIEAHI